MKQMWSTIAWFTALWVGTLLWGAEGIMDRSPKSVKLPIPGIHFVRVNDPTGLQGYDLDCAFGDEPKRVPDCFITTMDSSRTIAKVEITFDKAKEIANAFLNRVDPKDVKPAIEMSDLNPPVNDVLMLWNVKLGPKGSQGFVDRSKKKKDLAHGTLRALLLLESSLAMEP